MDLNLRDKVFIVSGGSSGIGEAITLALAAEGAIPVVVGRSEVKSKLIVGKLDKMDANYSNIVTQLGHEDNCLSIIDKVMADHGQLDGIVNNAGINDGVGLENGSRKKFIHSLHMNLLHYYDLVHYALPHLKRSKGSIVNVSSKTALTGQGGTSGYAASKGAQLSLTREWAVELAPFGIRVNAIVPAEVMTPLYEKWLTTFENPGQKLTDITSKIPFQNRMTKSEEIADSTMFLLSEKSGHTTGQWLVVDGGYVHLDRAFA